MRKQKNFLFEDDKLVIDIVCDRFPVLTHEELKEKIKDVMKDARQIVADLITDVQFKTLDFERQLFFIPLDGKDFAIAIQIEADKADRDLVIERLEKAGFVEVD